MDLVVRHLLGMRTQLLEVMSLLSHSIMKVSRMHHDSTPPRTHLEFNGINSRRNFFYLIVFIAYNK